MLGIVAIITARSAQQKDRTNYPGMANGHIIAYCMSFLAFIFSIVVLTTFDWHKVDGGLADFEIGIFRYKSSTSSRDFAEKYDCDIFSSVATDGFKECAKGFEDKCGVSRAFAIIGLLCCFVTLVALCTVMNGLRRRWRGGRERLFDILEWTAFWSTAIALLCFAIVGGAQVSMHVGLNNGKSKECNLDALLAGKTELGVTGITLCTLAGLLCTFELFFIGLGDMNKLDCGRRPPVRAEPHMNDAHVPPVRTRPIVNGVQAIDGSPPPLYPDLPSNIVPTAPNPAHDVYHAQENNPRVLNLAPIQPSGTCRVVENNI